MSLTIADVNTEFGNYYRNDGQGESSIIGLYYQPSVTHGFFNPMRTSNTQERGTKFLKNSVLQRYQSGFTPKGGSEFKPWKIDLAHMKVDEQETFEELLNSYNMFLVGIDTADKKSWPFVRWYMEHMLNQVMQDYELNEVYFGVEGSVIPGTPTANGASMDGLGTQLAASILAGKTTPVAGPPAWSNDAVDFVTEIEDWVKVAKGTSNSHKLMIENDIDYIFMATDKLDLYADGLDQKYNTNYNRTGIGLLGAPKMLPLKRTNIQLVGLPSMGSSERIFMTPSSNRGAYDRIPKGRLPLMIETVDRHVKIFGDIWKGIGFKWGEFVICNQLA